MSDKTKDKKIYIILMHTKTVPSKLIHLVTQKPYSHASISTTINLSNMYSFARKKVWNPFYGGFIKEDINSGILKRQSNTTCRIYELPVTNEEYMNVMINLNEFISDMDKYSYNYLGLIGAAINYPFYRNNSFFCSEFIAHLLNKSNIKLFNKPASLVKPMDFHNHPRLTEVYSGKLKDFKIKDEELTMKSY